MGNIPVHKLLQVANFFYFARMHRHIAREVADFWEEP